MSSSQETWLVLADNKMDNCPVTLFIKGPHEKTKPSLHRLVVYEGIGVKRTKPAENGFGPNVWKSLFSVNSNFLKFVAERSNIKDVWIRRKG